MSGGKKKYKNKPRRTYSEKEIRRAIHETADDAVKRTLLLAILAARDQFNLDADGTVDFMNRIDRYVQFEKDGLVNLKDASQSLLKNTGIDLRLVRWKPDRKEEE